MQVAVNNSTQIIEMLGNNLGLRANCTIVEVSESIEQQIQAAFAQPNGGVQYANGVVTALPENPTVIADRLADTQARQRAVTAFTYLSNVNFAARKTAIDATTLPVAAKTILKAINKTEWALAVLLRGVIVDDPGE